MTNFPPLSEDTIRAIEVFPPVASRFVGRFAPRNPKSKVAAYYLYNIVGKGGDARKMTAFIIDLIYQVATGGVSYEESTMGFEGVEKELDNFFGGM